MTHPVDTFVGNRLHAIRILRGLSQQDLGKAASVSAQQVQKYETGATRVSASKLFEFAVALNVDINEFFRGLKKTELNGNDAAPILAPTSLQSLNLLCAFESIPDGGTRKKILDITKTLANSRPVPRVRHDPQSRRKHA